MLSKQIVASALETEAQARADLAGALDAMLLKAPGQSISIVTLRHKLRLLGLDPSEMVLHEILLDRYEAVPERPWAASGRRPRTWSGVSWQRGSLEALWSALARRWEGALESGGMPEAMAVDPASEPEFTTPLLEVQDRGTGLPTTDLGRMVQATHLRREVAGAYFHKLAEYFWRAARWRRYPPFDRAVVARRLETGESYEDLGEYFGVDKQVIKRLLRKHEMEAGIRV